MSMIVDDAIAGRHQIREELLRLLERPDDETDPEAAAAYDRAAWERDFHAQANHQAAAELPPGADPFNVEGR